MGKTLYFKNPPRIVGTGTVVGKKEKDGPLADCFDLHDRTDKFGQKTFEQAESEMQRLALNIALKKSERLNAGQLEMIFAGDLNNQCTVSCYGMEGLGIPFFGLYGACSTAAEALTLAAMTVSAGYYRDVAAVSSSHNSVAERLFRFPLEYGSQRPPTAQWTATGAGAFLLSAWDGKQPEDERAVVVTEAHPGRIVNKGITDASNMGAAMAPAAAHTLLDYFIKGKKSPEEFDLILTGDLGKEGSSICRELTAKEGLTLGARYNDCGIMLYDGEQQDTHSGGSGCGCSACVTAGLIVPQMKKGLLKKVALIGTGALMSPSSVCQGLSIGGIAHMVVLESR